MNEFTRQIENEKRKAQCEQREKEAEMRNQFDPRQCEGNKYSGQTHALSQAVEPEGTRVRQPLLDCMIENSRRLENIEDAVRSIKGVLFGEYPKNGDCGQEDGQTSLEEQAEDTQRTISRIEEELQEMYERLTN